MRFSTLALVAPLLSGVLASPTPNAGEVAADWAGADKREVAADWKGAEKREVAADGAGAEGARLAKRAPEGIHLIDCGAPSTGGYSAVIYCATDSNCNFIPSSGNIVNLQVFHTWEQGFEESVTFSTGVKFYWKVATNGQSVAHATPVGLAHNKYHNDYVVYKDDGHVMYKDASGKSCKTRYYILSPTA